MPNDFIPIETVSSKLGSIVISPGQFIFTTDTKSLYVDVSTNTREQVSGNSTSAQKSYKYTLLPGWTSSGSEFTWSFSISDINNTKPILFGLPSPTTRVNETNYCTFGILFTGISGNILTVSAISNPNVSVDIEVIYYPV
jgi:hypothetical protein